MKDDKTISEAFKEEWEKWKRDNPDEWFGVRLRAVDLVRRMKVEDPAAYAVARRACRGIARA